MKFQINNLTKLGRGLHTRHSSVAIAFWLVLLTLTACGASPVERGLVGTWQSRTSSANFVFSQDNMYTFNRPGEDKVTGKYHVLGSPKTLADAQFDLDTIGIRFMPTGDAFYIYVDGAGGSELFYRVE
jgi:hypothetical protein